MKNDEVAMKKIDCWLLALSIGFLITANLVSVGAMSTTSHAQAEFLKAYTQKMNLEIQQLDAAVKVKNAELQRLTGAKFEDNAVLDVLELGGPSDDERKTRVF